MTESLRETLAVGRTECESYEKYQLLGRGEGFSEASHLYGCHEARRSTKHPKNTPIRKSPTILNYRLHVVLKQTRRRIKNDLNRATKDCLP